MTTSGTEPATFRMEGQCATTRPSRAPVIIVFGVIFGLVVAVAFVALTTPILFSVVFLVFIVVTFMYRKRQRDRTL